MILLLAICILYSFLESDIHRRHHVKVVNFQSESGAMDLIEFEHRTLISQSTLVYTSPPPIPKPIYPAGRYQKDVEDKNGILSIKQIYFCLHKSPTTCLFIQYCYNPVLSVYCMVLTLIQLIQLFPWPSYPGCNGLCMTVFSKVAWNG